MKYCIAALPLAISSITYTAFASGIDETNATAPPQTTPRPWTTKDEFTSLSLKSPKRLRPWKPLSCWTNPNTHEKVEILISDIEGCRYTLIRINGKNVECFKRKSSIIQTQLPVKDPLSNSSSEDPPPFANTAQRHASNS